MIREAGYRHVQVVERWNAFARIRQDLFGFIDVLAVGDDGTVLAVQATSRSNVSARVTKITEDCADKLAAIRRAGWRIEVHGWAKAKSGRYECRIVDMS